MRCLSRPPCCTLNSGGTSLLSMRRDGRGFLCGLWEAECHNYVPKALFRLNLPHTKFRRFEIHRRGEDKRMAQARRKEGTFRAPVPKIFVQQNGSGETPNAFSSSPGKTVSVVASKCLRSSAPFMRVAAGRICHAYPGAESVREEAARAKRWLHKVFELVPSVHRLVRLVKPWRQEGNV